MVLYKKKNVPIFRYIFAIIIFVLGLTLTVSDVFGLQLPFGQHSSNSYNNYINKIVENSDDDARGIKTTTTESETINNPAQGTDSVPTSVPEPSTIILLISGLGLLRMAKRKNS